MSREKVRSIFVQRTETNSDIWRKKKEFEQVLGKLLIGEEEGKANSR